jgi:hypothetical protein
MNSPLTYPWAKTLMKSYENVGQAPAKTHIMFSRHRLQIPM